MYLPENDAQLRDILSDLRLYAQLNGLPGLAEELDDALMLLAAETRRNARAKPALGAKDGRWPGIPSR